MPNVAKDLSISLLLDFYGAMLTDNQREAIDYYYNQDFSLAESAELNGISCQGVRDSVKRGEKQLLEFEEKLGLYRRFHTIEEKLEEIKRLSEEIQKENALLTSSAKIKNNVDALLRISETMNQ